MEGVSSTCKGRKIQEGQSSYGMMGSSKRKDKKRGQEGMQYSLFGPKESA